MHLKDVLNKCKERGYTITAQGIYLAGKKNGFLRKVEFHGIVQKSLEFDKEKFLQWLDKAIEEIPPGWLSVKEISKKFDISVSQAYLLIKDDDSGARVIGTRNILYADPERIKGIIDKHKRKHRENWED